LSAAFNASCNDRLRLCGWLLEQWRF
jgi:hypothetical protein